MNRKVIRQELDSRSHVFEKLFSSEECLFSYEEFSTKSVWILLQICLLFSHKYEFYIWRLD